MTVYRSEQTRGKAAQRRNWGHSLPSFTKEFLECFVERVLRSFFNMLTDWYYYPRRPSFDNRKMAERCPRCSNMVYFAEEIKALGKKWHKLCFKCGEYLIWHMAVLSESYLQSLRLNKERERERMNIITESWYQNAQVM